MATRRSVLRGVGVVGASVIAGCLGGPDSPTAGQSGQRADGDDPTGTDDEIERPPLAEESRYLGYDIGTLDEAVVSGGVPKDGIPAIDEPTFTAAGSASLDDGAPVFGLVRGGDVRAYPQRILVHHEIVNDTVDGEPVAVTYCPLTGTAQGFERGPVEFGVSGNLVNSNLVMYDRGTDSRWPQMLATAIDGPLAGETLREFRVVWTTWGKWRGAYPETRVLTEDTGYTRRYGSDPYGRYDPPGGYYTSDRTLFEPLARDGRAHPKSVVVGTRTAEGALAFDKETLLSAGVLTGTIDGKQYVAVADDRLSTGYVYANPDGVTVEQRPDGYRVAGETADADSLPLARSLAFDAMWFAWAGFYPESEYVD
ncbi:DUF3179 domain-containing protein [Halomicroarcula sp. GCM10025709]|uniref:DUF3179 domain-containing protein n=1 Tax=Haloarcula TaxID=2237 RepID=UPI0024C32AB7|nr:DUF3179 domain-containing protein [Halomicroarcula sp. YJ-61-S]